MNRPHTADAHLLSGTLSLTQGPMPRLRANQPGLALGRYRIWWAGRPRVLGGRPIAPEAIAAWLAERWPREGCSCLAECGGSWALCVEDRFDQRVWLATDRLGSTPIFYEETAGELRFSTCLEGVAEGSPRRADPRILVQYLTLRHAAGAEQLVAGVRRVLPGQCLRLEAANGRVQTRTVTYFRSPLHASGSNRLTASEAADEIDCALRDELHEGWTYHTEAAGGGVGLLFSGGLDSAYVLYALNPEERARVQLTTFGFDERSPDLAYARQCLPTVESASRWQPLVLAARQTAAALQRVILNTGQPVDHPNFLIREAAYRDVAERGVRTVLAGEGADTLLGGAWYVSMQKVFAARRLRRAAHLPTAALRVLGRLLPRRRGQLRLVSEPDWRKVCLLAKAYLPVDWLEETLAPWGGVAVANYPYHQTILDRHGEEHALHGVYEQGLMANMSQELLAEQRLAIAAGTHQWNPYLDGRFPERVGRFPAALRTRGWRAKYLLYRAARRRLPPPVLRRAKCGCPAPLVEWFCDEQALGGLVDLLREPNSFCGEFLGRAPVRAAVDRFRQRPNTGDAEILWVLMNLEQWSRLVLRGRARDGATSRARCAV